MRLKSCNEFYQMVKVVHNEKPGFHLLAEVLRRKKLHACIVYISKSGRPATFKRRHIIENKWANRLSEMLLQMHCGVKYRANQG